MEFGHRWAPFRVNSNIRLAVEGIKFGYVHKGSNPFHLNMRRKLNAISFSKWGKDVNLYGLFRCIIIDILDRLECVISDGIEELMSRTYGLCLIFLTLEGKVINKVGEHLREAPHQILYSFEGHVIWVARFLI